MIVRVHDARPEHQGRESAEVEIDAFVGIDRPDKIIVRVSVSKGGYGEDYRVHVELPDGTLDRSYSERSDIWGTVKA